MHFLKKCIRIIVGQFMSKVSKSVYVKLLKNFVPGFALICFEIGFVIILYNQ